MVGSKGTILTSAEGLEWTKKASGIEGDSIGLRGVAYGEKGYVAVGEGGKRLVSADGTNWKSSSTGTENDLWTVTWCSGYYISTGALDTPERSVKKHLRDYISSDGEKWSAMGMGETLPFYGAACGGDRTVVVVGKRILQSDPLPEAK